MIAKEKKELFRLRAENEELKIQIEKNLKIYGDQLCELIHLRTTMSLIQSAMNGRTE